VENGTVCPLKRNNICSINYNTLSICPTFSTKAILGFLSHTWILVSIDKLLNSKNLPDTSHHKKFVQCMAISRLKVGSEILRIFFGCATKDTVSIPWFHSNSKTHGIFKKYNFLPLFLRRTLPSIRCSKIILGGRLHEHKSFEMTSFLWAHRDIWKVWFSLSAFFDVRLKSLSSLRISSETCTWH